MTKEQMRIAIAEACGWTEIEHVNLPAAIGWFGIPTELIQLDMRRNPIPNYAGSLDAMHEAEKVLSVLFEGTPDGCECNRYIRILHEVCGGVPNCFAHHCATAAQRAEAFCRTVPSKQNPSLSI